MNLEEFRNYRDSLTEKNIRNGYKPPRKLKRFKIGSIRSYFTAYYCNNIRTNIIINEPSFLIYTDYIVRSSYGKEFLK